MKNFFLLNFLFLVIFLSGQAKSDNNYEIIYELNYKPSTKDTLKKREDFLLLRNKTKSFFLSYLSYKADSLFVSETEKGSQALNIFAKAQSTLKHSKFNYMIEKDFSNQKLVIQDKIFSDKYQYEETFAIFNWKPSEETKRIGDLNCKKATTHFAGRDYVAWYCEEIQLQDGPYKFSGLPGLIIKIYDTKEEYVFTLKSIKKVDELNLPIYSGGKKIIETTKEKFILAKKSYEENKIGSLKARGIVFQDEENLRNRMKERRERNNNEIEIEE